MYAVAPVLWKGTFLFVGFMILGLGMMDAGLCYLAKKLKKPGAIVLYIVSFFCCLGGALALKKAGLEEFSFSK